MLDSVSQILEDDVTCVFACTSLLRDDKENQNGYVILAMLMISEIRAKGANGAGEVTLSYAAVCMRNHYCFLV